MDSNLLREHSSSPCALASEAELKPESAKLAFSPEFWLGLCRLILSTYAKAPAGITATGPAPLLISIYFRCRPKLYLMTSSV